MHSAGAVKYPVHGVTLHRVAVGQRSQGDGEEQTAFPFPTSQEAGKGITTSQEAGKGITKTSAKPEPNPPAIAEDTKPQKPKESVEVKSSDADSLLPEVNALAQKLTMVSVMSTPDSYLLNSPPKDTAPKNRILLTPKVHNSVTLALAKDRGLSLHSQTRKEPKFVPYEPYRCCVKPIYSKKKRKSVKKNIANKTVPEEATAEETTVDAEVEKQDDGNSAEKLNMMVKDFEKERASWEEQASVLKAEMKQMKEQLKEMKNDKTNLENQLKVQTQVNTELKKLLVASVGEDVQGRVQVLTEDKARMATMIRRYSERVDRDFEEKERMEIQCDVWRSKFLGTSMLVDELVGWKATLMRQFDEAQEALNVMIDEHQISRQHVLNMYRMNKQLRDAFDPLAAAHTDGVTSLTSADLVSLAVDGDVLAETVRDRLLGDLGRAVGCNLKVDGLETCTPGEKMARQLLGLLYKEGGALCNDCSTVSPGRSAMLHRFHPNTRYEHVTVNCCSHCNGEIKVV